MSNLNNIDDSDLKSNYNSKKQNKMPINSEISYLSQKKKEYHKLENFQKIIKDEIKKLEIKKYKSRKPKPYYKKENIIYLILIYLIN